MKKLLVLSLFAFVSSSFVFAEDEEEKIPHSGIIASSQAIGNQGAAVDNPYSGMDASKVSGSVSRKGDKLVAKLFNNTDSDKIRVSARIEQVNSKGRVVKRDYLNGTLKGGDSIERSFSRREGTNPQIRIVSLKNLTPKAKKKDDEEGSSKKR